MEDKKYYVDGEECSKEFYEAIYGTDEERKSDNPMSEEDLNKLVEELKAKTELQKEESKAEQTGPLSESEFIELKNHLEGIKSFLPEHLMGPFWSWCNRIRGLKTPQPCSCKSSAKHWGSCVEELRKFVKERE